MSKVDKVSGTEVVRGNPHRAVKLVAGTALLGFWLMDAASLHLVRSHFGAGPAKVIGWGIVIVAVVLLVAGLVRRQRG